MMAQEIIGRNNVVLHALQEVTTGQRMALHILVIAHTNENS